MEEFFSLGRALMTLLLGIARLWKARETIRPGAGCIKKWLKLTMISGYVNQSEQRILYLITI